MRIIILFLLLFLCAFSVNAQDKTEQKAAPSPVSVKADTKLPESIALTIEETNAIRIRQLRSEKLSVQLSELQAKLKAEGELLQADFTAILGKYGLTQEQARGYDVINGESESDRPILLKKKAPPKTEAPKP